ncbi:ATP-binding protein [Conexibacter woesei]|uniref:Putative anti-sigma regulatory factor, serine/threonine protein kinase n=1 Tax=Conexibacter woesei (strain DSM 14684 / CCUG 47730 / CIP 108061 / JCM 11494 / NBRC 100937 / ID131577) TaxID=469383 RepID=D3F803_CONWI|nr:ATP-binding protein [Conexibacter woesei]ADB52897.1 putative anti-sigma regulatory factor, serine/threonine protein kinase [Conexibacter woesei DSM 14684]
MRLTLPAVAASVPEARHALSALARELGASERVVADVALAVSEACTNVVLHAYRELEEPGTLTVDAAPHGALLEVLVSDEGSGLRARDDSPGLGMGMALMAAVATGLQLDHDGAATRLHLTFDLRPERRDDTEEVPDRA